ncbi:MAG: helix-turn-helix domain-containing protein [Pirellulales bacterium]
MNPSPAIVNLFNSYRNLTGSPESAATLVLAQVRSGQTGELPASDRADSPLNPPQIAKQLRVSPAKVIEWIKSGQLKASNIATGTRPRFVVQRSELDRFLQVRQPDLAAPSAKRRQARASTDRY